jgi:hypothetical protein
MRVEVCKRVPGPWEKKHLKTTPGARTRNEGRTLGRRGRGPDNTPALRYASTPVSPVIARAEKPHERPFFVSHIIWGSKDREGPPASVQGKAEGPDTGTVLEICVLPSVMEGSRMGKIQ